MKNEETMNEEAPRELANSYRDEIERGATQTSEVVDDPSLKERLKRLAESDATRAVLRVGDRLRANGLVYRVRKVTKKDIVIRLEGGS